MSIVSRPIVFTADLPAWRVLLEAFGGVVLVENPGWWVYAVGSGRVALHDAAHSPHEPGHVQLGFEVPDLDAWSGRVGVEHVIEEAGHGTAARVIAPDGVWFWVDGSDPAADAAATAARESGREPTPGIAVLPLWYTPDPRTARGVLEAVGATPRITGDDGTWADLVCSGGGLVAVHADERAGTVLSFEHDGPLEDLQERLTAVGVEAALVDETYGRSLRVPDPDGRTPIWVNEAQTDLYGFTRNDA